MTHGAHDAVGYDGYGAAWLLLHLQQFSRVVQEVGAALLGGCHAQMVDFL